MASSMAENDRRTGRDTGSNGVVDGEARCVPGVNNTSNGHTSLPHRDWHLKVFSRIKSTWARTGIDRRTYESMFKGALAPTIATACFQATAFAETFTTLGYLVGIMAVLSVVIAPRAKFLQTMLLNILFAGIACCVALLAMFCTVKARINSVGFEGPGSGGPGTSGLAAQDAATSVYNSSASAVAGVWLFVQIYGISVIRSKNPQFTIPCITYAIFANVSCVYSPQFATMSQAESFAYRLLSAFYVGFAIATGVSLLIFPLSSRQVAFKLMVGYVESLRGAVSANLIYMRSLEDTDMFAAQKTNTKGCKPANSPEAEAFKAKVRELSMLHSKLHTDLPFAKREVALGRLGPDNIQEIYRLLRQIMVPTVGLSCMPDIFEHVAERRGWDRAVSVTGLSVSDDVNEDVKVRIEVVNEWHELMRLLREPFGKMSETIDNGLQHILITFQLQTGSKRPGKPVDEESSGSGPLPGEKNFSAYFKTCSDEFLKTKETMLRGWCSIHGIDLPNDFFSDPDQEDFQAPSWMHEGYLSPIHQALRRQLFLCLYMEFLLLHVAKRTHQLMLYADALSASGKLSKRRLVVPGFKRLRKWLLSLVNNTTDADGDDERDTDGQTTTIYLGDAYKVKRDPEHLPPANTWERFTNQLRKIPHFFSSPASAFGFRSACATMSIAIIAFLQPTQIFFTTERLFWAQIMVSISMSPSAGQSLRNFLLRIAGTALALLLSWIAWYIVDGHTAGVLVFLFIFLHGGPYILLKYPQYTPVGMVGPITMILILGYELQVRKIGVAVATSNGQAYYPIYELGPIRLATVCAGLFVAWIWTIFPYPIAEHNQMRKGIGQALYLLANYYSVMCETIRSRLRDTQGNMNLKDSPGRRLEKARFKVFSKTNLAIQNLRIQSGFLSYDIPIGGRFPVEQYQSLLAHFQSMLNFMSLVSLASSTFIELRESDDENHNKKWLRNFEKLVADANIGSQQITNTLSLMSASVTSGQALPPFLKVPEAYLLEQRLDELDKDLLSVRHIAEPGYASFACMQIGTKCIIDDLKKVVSGIRELIGELDFSYHIESTAQLSQLESDETLVYAKDDGADGGRRTKLD